MGRNDKDFADVTLACGDLKLHSGEKSNKCNQCDYASSFASDLRTHLKRHSGEKSNKCIQCNKSFNRAEHLISHMHKLQQIIQSCKHFEDTFKTHSGEKSNKCNQM